MRYNTPQFIKAWPGYVIMPDALNFPQLNTWQDAVDALIETQDGITWPQATSNPRTAEKIVKALCHLVKEWHLENFPESVSVETFPATPRVQATLLIGWLCGLMSNLFAEADDTPEKKAE